MQQRYYSLDVFRGATVALMILVNNPGTWSYMFSPLKHADWHGATPTDLVFPFFLFAVGNALAFVMPKFQAGAPKDFWKKVIKRTVLIFLIGLFLNWWPFIQWQGESLGFRHWEDPNDPSRGVRIFGVLQRIALCYFFASIMAYYLKPKLLIAVSFLLLLLYWFICYVLGATGDPYSLSGWFGTEYDLNILGLSHIYKGEGVPFDPEGIMSTGPAIIQVVFGFLLGQYIRLAGVVEWTWKPLKDVEKSNFVLVSGLMVIGVILTILGLFWDLFFPINKKIWTSSYVVYTTGLAALIIGVLIWFIEILKVKNAFTHFFDVFGKNPLFIFVLSGLLPRFLALFRWETGVNADGVKQYTSPLRWFYTDVCQHFPGPPEWGSFVYALCFLGVCWFIAFMMDKRKIYIKV